MKDTNLTKATDYVVDLKLKAVDRLIEELVEPLLILGSPEEMISKKYEEWTSEDIQRLSVIYGVKEPNTLSNLIFGKELEKVKTLEAEVK